MILSHEYGHTKQLEELGVLNYVVFVVIPSVTGLALTELGLLPEGYYMNLPWEYDANERANISHNDLTYEKWTETAAKLYWAFVNEITNWGNP